MRHKRLLYSTLLLCVGTAISTANGLTTQTTTALPPIQPPVPLERNNWTQNLEGLFQCDLEEKAVSNCDILIWLWIIAKGINQQLLEGIIAHVLEVLGQIQEVRAALHTRKQRSAKAAKAFDVTSHLRGR